MKVALVHDHLVQFGGAERVLSAMHSMYPQAPIYTLLYDKRRFGDMFPEQLVRPSFLQTIPLFRSRPKWLLPLMPTATESHHLGKFDVVLSSSSAFAKGIITGSEGLHICYLHTPTRYLWSDTHEYIDGLRVPRPIKLMLPHLLSYLRHWDYQAAQRVHYFIANSETVRRRIKTYYGRESIVLHPPVDVDQFSVSDTQKSYYLIGGRLVPYKRYDIVIKAFNKIGKPLKIF
ncbi:MAG: glycosyltransferase, partial [bacterium]|nr:glycosyltransferase [bacterium]